MKAVQRFEPGRRARTGAAAMILGILAGCAATVTRAILDVPPVQPSRALVSDNRTEHRVSFKTINYAGTTSILTIDPMPPVAEALARFIEGQTSAPRVNVDLLRLDVVVHAGFATTDDIRCQMESRVAFGAGSSRLVRSSARIMDNLSPFGSQLGKIALTTCLAQHAKDIATSR